MYYEDMDAKKTFIDFASFEKQSSGYKMTPATDEDAHSTNSESPKFTRTPEKHMPKILNSYPSMPDPYTEQIILGKLNNFLTVF